MIAVERLGANAGLSSVQRRTLFNFIVCAACLIPLGGCSTTAKVIKENLDYRPAVANAFSRALTLTSLKKKSSASKLSAFPPIPMQEETPRVRSFIRHYAYEHRGTMKSYLATVEKHLPMLKAVARENGLPEEVSYLVMLESGADPEARSPANALGMWQFMPATARSYGLRVDSWVDERLDPIKSTKAAMTYLKDLYGVFGCWRLALSAYNSGENKMNQVLCQEDAQEYDEICSSPRLRRETREFFPKFLAMAVIANNPKRYGFPPLNEVRPEERYEIIPIEGSFNLETLARVIDAPVSSISEMNPALIRGMTPTEGTPYSLRVPAGKKDVLVRKLDNLPEEQAKSHVTHVVNRGDNVSRILKRYQISKTKLAEVNPDVNLNSKLRLGSRLIIPVFKAKAQGGLKHKRLSRVQ